jgi:hypothetical protein
LYAAKQLSYEDIKMFNVYAEQYAAPSAAAHMIAVAQWSDLGTPVSDVELGAASASAPSMAVAGTTPFVPSVKPSQTITNDQLAVLEEQLLSQFECGEITAMQYSQQSDALLRLKS